MPIAVLVTCSYGICSHIYMTRGSDTHDIDFFFWVIHVTFTYDICSDTYMTKGSDTFDISPTYTTWLSHKV